MHLPASFFLQAFLLAASFPAASQACTPPPGNGSTPNPFVYGDGRRPHPQTAGWNINHLCLNVGNLTASLEFYVGILGMTHIFSLTSHPAFTLVYLGHPSGGRNGTAWQDPQEMSRLKNNIPGLVELIYIDKAATNPPRADPEGSLKRTNSLGHVGLIVPDVAAAQKYLEEKGVPILKTFGAPVDPKGPIPSAFGLGLIPEGNEELLAAIIEATGVTAKYSLMVGDPDGNLIEILPLDEGGLFDT